MAGERIKWFTETDIAVADDPELLTLMHEAGCAEVLIGLESPTAAGVDGVEQRRDWKRSRFDDYQAAIERIQSHGIAVNGCFVLGLDGDGPEVFEAVERFVRESGQFDVQITVMTAFPGTPLYARLKAEGRLLTERRLGAVHALRRQLPTAGHVARDAPARGARARPPRSTRTRSAPRAAQRFHDQRRRYLRRQHAMRCSA